MASSSSSFVPIRASTYDVFLSFRGEDTRNNFVDHLHAALVRNGIRVFKDDVMLHKGNLISSDLLSAIEESRFAVVVFSKNYANSSWCLDELTKIKDCQDSRGQTVLPIFYHVDPSDVRGQKRDFATAFQQHEEKFSEEMDKVNKWREALATAGNLSGWHISPDNGGESVFIDEIVQKISSDIKPCGMEKNLVDIEYRINRLKSLLDMEATHEVRMIGIYGMGGIGKTTIVRALFRRISYKFDGSSFVIDVRENGSSKRDICALHQNILKDMVHHDESKITDPEVGAEMIQRRCGNKKVLLVLDDVDNFKQLEFLAARHVLFGVGSRIIITTRDESLLSDTDDKYKPAVLLKEHAVELFSRHAFREVSPLEGFEELSDRVIHYSGGLPLALKVLGSYFRKKKADVWESALNRLAKTPNKEIIDILKISFDGLCDDDKKIFLDIACFFKGYDKEYVTRVLDSFGFDPTIGICTLIEKSLITISNEQRIDMHDVLQEMGFEIIRKSYPNSRLWKFEDHDFITKNRNPGAVEGIVVHREEFRYSGDVFEKMNNIRLLKICGHFTSCEPTNFPHKLRWLSWNSYPFPSLPVANMLKLVGLEMVGGEIEYLWTGYQHLPDLKFIDLCLMSKLKSLPDVSGAINLERLTVTCCENLVEIHKSVGTLKNLAYLNLTCCTKLPYLPSIEEMPELETINLTDCSSLERFPEVSSSMVKLKNIYLDECSNLRTIPNSICELKNLKILHLQDCESLQDLPKELGSMGKLEELLLGLTYEYDLQDSINLHALTKLCGLRKLDLSGRQMEERDFPLNFHEFSSLEELHLSRNHKLVHLPGSISRLYRLKHLELNECQELQNIQGLPSTIQVLKAGDCMALEKIEDLSKEYASLHTIFLPGCVGLLENHENEAYLDKMLQQSFVEKCIAVDRLLCIWIPGSKIPSWFEEQQGYELGKSPSPCLFGDEYQKAIKLPPQRHTSIMGFVVCVVHKRYPSRALWGGDIDEEDETVSMVYIPESVFWKMNDDFGKGDWSLLVESGRSVSIIVTSADSDILKIKRCGAYIVNKEDKESIQQIKTPIPPDYFTSIDHIYLKDYIYVDSGVYDFSYSIRFSLEL